MKTVYILNDTTAGWHSGCAATMSVLRDLLAKAGYTEIGFSTPAQQKPKGPIDEADLVICNGEGTIHPVHDGKGQWLLKTLERAAQRGQKTALVNALYQAFPCFYRPKLDLVHCRDLFSARDWHGSFLAPELALSAVPAKENVQRPTRLVFGEAKFYKAWEPPEEPFVSLRNMSFAEAVEALEGSVYVTGEHHGAYAAIAAGALPVLLPTETWKLESLNTWFGHTIPATDEPWYLKRKGSEGEWVDHYVKNFWREYEYARKHFLRLPRLTADKIP